MTDEPVDATFTIDSWDEAPFDDAPGTAKLTRASVTKTYAGGVAGTSVTEWLMAYQPDDTATFVGLERITGTIDGRQGTLVLRHVGTFEDGAATADLTVLSGTDALADAHGSGRMVADPGGRITLALDA